MPKPDLDAAYGLKTPEDSKRLYADWAETYDSGFAAEMDFVLPERVAEAFAEAGGEGPVLDVGAGTGLLGEALVRLGVDPVDATDISPDMLAVAARKGVYREVVEGDILKGLDLAGGKYAGIVSSGTFTTGHVGPEAFDELLRLAAPGALLALSINGVHYEAAGFAAKLAALKGQITGLTLPEVRYYGPNARGPHKDESGYIAVFRKA